MPEPAQLRGYPLLRLGVEGNGKLKQKCQRGSEFRCAPAVPAFVGRLVRPAPAVADVAGEPPRNGRLLPVTCDEQAPFLKPWKKGAASATRFQYASSAARAPSAPPCIQPLTRTAAFIAPVDVPEIASTLSQISSRSLSSTPQVNAPSEPPPCKAKSTRTGSRSLLSRLLAIFAMLAPSSKCRVPESDCPRTAVRFAMAGNADLGAR
jgi:hypothetical protein